MSNAQERAVITLRPADERGHADHGWLDTYHTFSFANYYDSRHMGFRSLRVINDDTVAPGGGFPTHPHRDMEILTYVTEGALEHRDSMGNGSVLEAGWVQRMTAGTGVTHSEFNHSQDERLKLLQIWLQPDRAGLEPGYEERALLPASRRGELVLVASPDGAGDSLTIHQDARLYAAVLEAGDRVEQPLTHGQAWLHVVRGRVRLGDHGLGPGDGAQLSDVDRITLEAAGEESELLLFDLA